MPDQPKGKIVLRIIKIGAEVIGGGVEKIRKIIRRFVSYRQKQVLQCFNSLHVIPPIHPIPAKV